MCELVLRETTLLPHPNPGLLSAEWIARLATVSPSMGLMLETTNAALLQPGAAHDNAPDKVPSQAPAHHRRSRQAECSLHYRPADRHRRDSGRPRRHASRDPRTASPLRTYPGSHRSKLPCRSPPSPCGIGPSQRMAKCCARLRSRACSCRMSISRRRRIFRRPSTTICWTRGINDWGGVSPLDPRFHQSRKTVAASGGTEVAHRVQRIQLAPASPRLPGVPACGTATRVADRKTQCRRRSARLRAKAAA